MDEYIKKSEAIKAIRENRSKLAMYTARAICAIEDLPTADVVPKSEVERWRRNLEAVLEEIPETKREVAREIFEEIEKLHLHVTNEFDLRRYNELKKKYTEGGK